MFAGLPDPSWISKPLERWVKASGITKHITFHCFRHTYATLQLANGTDIYTVSKMLGHTNVKTSQIYAKVIDKKKHEATEALKLDIDESRLSFVNTQYRRPPVSISFLLYRWFLVPFIFVIRYNDAIVLAL